MVTVWARSPRRSSPPGPPSLPRATGMIIVRLGSYRTAGFGVPSRATLQQHVGSGRGTAWLNRTIAGGQAAPQRIRDRVTAPADERMSGIDSAESSKPVWSGCAGPVKVDAINQLVRTQGPSAAGVGGRAGSLSFRRAMSVGAGAGRAGKPHSSRSLRSPLVPGFSPSGRLAGSHVDPFGRLPAGRVSWWCREVLE
jgi:hypothetical protein